MRLYQYQIGWPNQCSSDPPDEVTIDMPVLKQYIVPVVTMGKSEFKST